MFCVALIVDYQLYTPHPWTPLLTLGSLFQKCIWLIIYGIWIAGPWVEVSEQYRHGCLRIMDLGTLIYNTRQFHSDLNLGYKSCLSGYNFSTYLLHSNYQGDGKEGMDKWREGRRRCVGVREILWIQSTLNISKTFGNHLLSLWGKLYSFSHYASLSQTWLILTVSRCEED